MGVIGFLEDIATGNGRNAMWNARRVIGIGRPEGSWLWDDAVKYYSSLSVAGKNVLDMGSDYGVSPMFFLSRGALSVTGFSLWKQYFFDPRYTHRLELFTAEKIKDVSFSVLKADCEGCEYLLTKEHLIPLDDWIIAFHAPVENRELYEYCVANGVEAAPPPPRCEGFREEIAILKKKVA